MLKFKTVFFVPVSFWHRSLSPKSKSNVLHGALVALSSVAAILAFQNSSKPLEKTPRKAAQSVSAYPRSRI